MHEERALRRRKVPLLRRADVVRRVRCCLPETESAGLRAARARACHCARCLSGGGTARELFAPACRAAMLDVGSCSTNEHCAGERPLSFGLLPWCNVPASASQRQNQLAFASHALACATALAVSRQEAQHASLLRPRAVPRRLLSVRAVRTSTAQARGLSPSACCRGATCQLRPPIISRLSRGTRARHCARCLSGGGTARELAARARRAAVVVVGPCSKKGHCTGERPLSFGARPWCDVPAVSTKNQPAFAWHARARHFTRCLSVGGTAREIAARVRRATLIVVGLRSIKGHCTEERLLSFGARLWCDVPAVASQNQPGFAWHAWARHCTRVLSGGYAARDLLRALTVPRWL